MKRTNYVSEWRKQRTAEILNHLLTCILAVMIVICISLIVLIVKIQPAADSKEAQTVIEETSSTVLPDDNKAIVPELG